MAIEELAFGKICAMLDRALPRDLFDVAALPDKSPGLFAGRRFRAFLIAMCGTLDPLLHAYGRERLDRVTDDMIRRQLLPMLIRGEEPSAGGLRDAAWNVVAPFLRLEEKEREFTDRLQRGDLRVNLLFPDDPETVELLSRHPALLWKARNVREHAAKRARPRPSRS